MKMKYLLLLSIFSISATGLFAGDYFPYKPKEIRYSLRKPFDQPDAPKLDDAVVVITFGESGFSLSSGTPTSLRIELGKKAINIPDSVLREVGPIEIGSIDFYWVAGKHYLRATQTSDKSVKDMAEIVIQDAVPVELRIMTPSCIIIKRKAING